MKKNNKPLTYVEINKQALEHNLKALRKLSIKQKFELPTRPKNLKVKPEPHHIMAVVKGEAYGHGMNEVASLLDAKGVESFGVSNVDEGRALRKLGIKKPILLFESTLPDQAQDIIKYKLMPSIGSLSLAKSLDRHAKKLNRRIDVHLQVDTGMGRLGVWYEEAKAFIAQVESFRQLRIMGIFTHFPAADTDRSFTRQQMDRLYELVTSLDQSGLIIPYIHASNSMGLAGYQTQIMNVSRPGLMLYGLYPHQELKRNINLKPVMSVKSQVILLKSIPKGQSISYGRTFFTKKDMRVAIIPIGYVNGYSRSFSNKADVLIGGVRCSVLGRVTMDQIMVDVSDVSHVRVGNPVVLLGLQKKEYVSADELAKHAKTINYEIVCQLGNQLPRIYK